MSEAIQERAVDTSAWDGAAAMSAATNADDPAAAYKAICAGYRDTPSDPTVQDHWALPHHKAPGDPPNADGVRNALARLPQTQGLANRSEAESHLQNHLANDVNARSDVHDELRLTEFEDAEVQVRSESKRELDIRVVPWNQVITHVYGPEMFERGAFREVDPREVRLKAPDNEGEHRGPVVGKGMSIEERDDGAYMTFKVSKTQAGDELLTLVSDGVIKGASVGFYEKPGGTQIQQRNGQRVRVHQRSGLDHVLATWRPAYDRAAVIAMRSSQGEAAMAEPEAVDVAATPEPTLAPVIDMSAFDKSSDALKTSLNAVVDRLEKIEERARSQFEVPAAPVQEANQVHLGQWGSIVLKIMSGEKVPERELQERTVQDLITSDNAGIVPEQFVAELRGVIDPARPFMESTRRLPVPSAGTTIRVPKITQRPTVAEQNTEKAELSSQKTIIGSDTFDMVSKGGVGDLSLQLLKRSDPSFLDLYIRLLAEAYAIEAEAEALRALFDAVGGGITSASPMDPANLSLGAAFQTSFDAIRRPPDTIWLSTEAVGEFIDAKASTTNQPLYSNITTSATAAGGISGTVSGLRAVHVPGLDAHGSFAVVGPSSGFAWAEDGTYTLQVDVPAKAGRDVAIFGMLWFVPWYPDAFTVYNVAS